MDASEIQRRREALGLTRPQLARALGVSEATVWRWESGKARLEGLAAVGTDAILTRLERQRKREPAGAR